MGIAVVARAKAKPGKEAALERELRAVVGPTHEENGCRKYALHRSADDPSVFIMIERWTSKEALDQHLASAHVQKLFNNLPVLVDGPAEIQVLLPLPEGDPAKTAL